MTVPVDIDALIGYVPDHDEFCSSCGRKLELHDEASGFNHKTGKPRTITYRECPKFARSWRNLWWGGWGHDSLWGTMGSREWR